jgi:hypothetical protein
MRILAWTALLTLFAGVTPAVAQFKVGSALGKEFGNNYINRDQQIANAIDAAQDAFQAWATKGEATRGATGPLATLLQESDTIICASWLIAFDRAMTNLATAGAFNTDEGTALVRALQDLKNRVEAACQEVLNDNPPGVHGDPPPPGEGGGGELQPNTCPDCPYERNARDIAQYRVDAAQHAADRASARTKWLTEMWLSNPRLATLLAEETVAEAERTEERRYEELERAQAALKAAQAAYVRCLESCHKQVGFFDSNRNKLLVAVAAVGVTTVAMVGGGGTPTALASAPSPAPVATTPTPPPPPTTPVVTTPPAAPAPAALLSLIVGRWICAACRPVNDPDRHENSLRFCAQLIAIFQLLANSPLRIEHPAPWVTVTGELDERSGAYRATGMGPVSGFSNVSSSVTATFQRSGDTVTAVELNVTLGENGVFPGGRPVSYSVRLTKQP